MASQIDNRNALLDGVSTAELGESSASGDEQDLSLLSFPTGRLIYAGIVYLFGAGLSDSFASLDAGETVYLPKIICILHSLLGTDGLVACFQWGAGICALWGVIGIVSRWLAVRRTN